MLQVLQWLGFGAVGVTLTPAIQTLGLRRSPVVLSGAAGVTCFTVADRFRSRNLVPSSALTTSRVDKMNSNKSPGVRQAGIEKPSPHPVKSALQTRKYSENSLFCE